MIHWIGGAAVALAGVAAVRLIAPGLEGVLYKVVMVAGYLLSMTGILIIACGVRRGAIDAAGGNDQESGMMAGRK